MNLYSNWKRYISGLMLVLAAITLAFLVTSPLVQAQLQPWDTSNEVFVDLSVLPNSGIARSPKSLAGFYQVSKLGGQIADPPRRMPVSRFMAPPHSKFARTQDHLHRVKLIPPGRNQKISRVVSKRRLVANKPKKVSIKSRSPAKPLVVRSTAKFKPSKPVLYGGKSTTRLTKTTQQTTMAQPSARADILPPSPNIPSAPPPEPKVTKPQIKIKKTNSALAIPSKPQPQENQQASLPTANGQEKLVNVMFAPGASELGTKALKSLDKIAANLNNNQEVRMQLMAYAGELKMTASKARRLSLSRALAVRTYLISKGIRGTRIDVRALGNKLSSGLPNRVDLRVVGQ